MALGLKVTCTGWEPREIVYMYLRNGRCVLHRYSYERDTYIDMTLSEHWHLIYEDMETKWEVYDESKASPIEHEGRQ